MGNDQSIFGKMKNLQWTQASRGHCEDGLAQPGKPGVGSWAETKVALLKQTDAKNKLTKENESMESQAGASPVPHASFVFESVDERKLVGSEHSAQRRRSRAALPFRCETSSCDRWPASRLWKGCSNRIGSHALHKGHRAGTMLDNNSSYAVGSTVARKPERPPAPQTWSELHGPLRAAASCP